MSTNITWHDIALRLLLTFVAAGVLGFERGEGGRSAGLRTNLLVSLAACIAMIQTNILMNSNGKPGNSFVVMDTMRLPLGILSGIGFIGAGAIVKRGELVVGVTTAATLWFVTVMGLCFGGGQIGLGLASFGLGLLILWFLKQIENRIPREYNASVKVTVSGSGSSVDDIEAALLRSGVAISSRSFLKRKTVDSEVTVGWKIKWKSRAENRFPSLLTDLATRPDIRRMEFKR